MKQILCRLIIKGLAGYLVAKGLTDESTAARIAEFAASGFLASVGVIWSHLHLTSVSNPLPSPKAADNSNAPMRLGLLLALTAGVCLLTPGCAYLRSVTDRNTDPQTGVVNERTTVRCYTFWDSESALAKFRNTTGATSSNGFVFPSGTTIGTLNQETTSTNAETLITGIVAAAVRAAIK